MVSQVISRPPGLEVAGAMTACPALGHKGPQQGSQEQQAPAPTLLGRGAWGGLQRGLDEKAGATAQGLPRKVPERQRVQTDPTHAKSEFQDSGVALRKQQAFSECNQQHITTFGGLCLPQGNISLPSTRSSTPSNSGAGNVAPLSLADALGLGFATQGALPPPLISAPCAGMPSSVSTSPTGLVSVESEPSRPLVEKDEEVDAFVFGFTIRVAGGTQLGLSTSVPLDPVSGKPALYLRIDSVLPGGAVEAWNRQCGSSGAPEKVLLVGDKIIRVNNTEDTELMMAEFENCRLLRMLIVRTPSNTSGIHQNVCEQQGSCPWKTSM